MGFYKEIAIHRLVFASWKFQYAYFYDKVKVIEWVHLDTEIINEHIAFFVDVLKQYQEDHKALKAVNEIIVQASHDTGACYEVTKCAEIVFEQGKMVRGEGLEVLEEGMNAMDPDESDIYIYIYMYVYLEG